VSSLSAILMFSFFFSSRRRHTRFSRDWSSDVCSSDLALGYDIKVVRLPRPEERPSLVEKNAPPDEVRPGGRPDRRTDDPIMKPRSEERRVGKECRSRGSP